MIETLAFTALILSAPIVCFSVCVWIVKPNFKQAPKLKKRIK